MNVLHSSLRRRARCPEVVGMKRFAILLILLMFAVPSYATIIYQWVDDGGVINFSDDYAKVPPAFRNRENYKKAQKEYMEQAEGLGPYKFGKMSLTQYQMLSSRLEILSKEMETYQGQIAEAKNMLAKLSKEAKEAGADPSWLE